MPELDDLRARVAELEAAEARARATLYSIGDGVIATDVSGRIVQMNPAAEALTGWTEADARGRPVQEVFRIFGEQRDSPAEDPVARVLRDGRVVGLANHTWLIARDGVERPIADSGAPIRDAAGELTGAVLVFRDQTAERRAAAERNMASVAGLPEVKFHDGPSSVMMASCDDV